MKIMPDNETPKCPFIDCCYGIGLAGRGVCINGGDWEDPKCPQYEKIEDMEPL